MAATGIVAPEIIEYLRKIPTGFTTDGMGRLGIRGSMIGLQSVIRFGGRSIAGPALTIKIAPNRGTRKSPHNLYSIMRTAKPGDVVVIECRRPNHFIFGENLTHHAIRCGVQSIVMDGGARDVAEIRDLNFPLFYMGYGLQSYSLLSEIVDVNVPIVCAEAQVYPGDIIHGDEDGINVIPFEALDKVIESAKHVAAVEEEQAAAIERDVPLEELYKILAKKK